MRLDDLFGFEDVVEVAGGVVLLGSGGIGGPLAVNDELFGFNKVSRSPTELRKT